MKTTETLEATRIVLKSVYSKDRKLNISPAKDPRTGWYHGVERLSEEDKKRRSVWVDPSTRLTITHNMSFDLSDPVDRMNWEWIKHSNAIAMSFEECQKSKEALFYVDSEEQEALKAVSADELVHKAMTHVFNDRGDSLADRARILGHNMEDESPVTIRQLLLKLAKNPQTTQKVIDAYESNRVAIHLLFLKSRDKNIVRLENGAFLYGNTVLGVTEEAVLGYMQDPMNRELILEIEKELQGKKKKAAATVTEGPTTDIPAAPTPSSAGPHIS